MGDLQRLLSAPGPSSPSPPLYRIAICIRRSGAEHRAISVSGRQRLTHCSEADTTGPRCTPVNFGAETSLFSPAWCDQLDSDGARRRGGRLKGVGEEEGVGGATGVGGEGEGGEGEGGEGEGGGCISSRGCCWGCRCCVARRWPCNNAGDFIGKEFRFLTF